MKELETQIEESFGDAREKRVIPSPPQLPPPQAPTRPQGAKGLAPQKSPLGVDLTDPKIQNALIQQAHAPSSASSQPSRSGGEQKKSAPPTQSNASARNNRIRPSRNHPSVILSTIIKADD